MSLLRRDTTTDPLGRIDIEAVKQAGAGTRRALLIAAVAAVAAILFALSDVPRQLVLSAVIVAVVFAVVAVVLQVALRRL